MALGPEVEDMALTFKKSSRSDNQKLNDFASFLPPFLIVSLKQKVVYLIFITYSYYNILKVSSS